MKTRVSLKYFVIECRFNNAFSTINLDSVRDGAYVINLDDKKNKDVYCCKNTDAYFDSFRIEYISKEVLNKIRDKSITYNIFRIKSDDSIMHEFYCIAFKGSMLV